MPRKPSRRAQVPTYDDRHLNGSRGLPSCSRRRAAGRSRPPEQSARCCFERPFKNVVRLRRAGIRCAVATSAFPQTSAKCFAERPPKGYSSCSAVFEPLDEITRPERSITARHNASSIVTTAAHNGNPGFSIEASASLSETDGYVLHHC